MAAHLEVVGRDPQPHGGRLWHLPAQIKSVDQFGASIKAQIDLRIEADNNRRFAKNFANDPDVGFEEINFGGGRGLRKKK